MVKDFFIPAAQKQNLQKSCQSVLSKGYTGVTHYQKNLKK